ncbi:hypothetical protein [Flavobacterium sp. KACC 22761]|uniref:hypothetical protein n=1 Tax=Flavobacterium sp. KACC 22761 TaxID=3092665 RepID=UPI002A75AF3E|nr:hypothetical protein [Flavobacterium sp. KACC 22761]WPO77051.1 hypothetical protein SCB73_12345 [Flavobacterium sp. KACC 22761]
MDILGNRLMASTIEEVIENTQEQTITFNLMFPYDFGNNLFEERYLKFNKVVFYQVEEIIIPLGRIPQIYHINDLGKSTRIVKTSDDLDIEFIRQKIEINTNVGKRIIEFSDYEFEDKK